MVNRTTEVGGVWAQGASDVIGTPAPSVTYVNSLLDEATINRAWPYTDIVASNNFNEIMQRMTLLMRQMESQGLLSYSILTNYGIGALVLGSDDGMYKALMINGPASGNVVDPVGNPLAWKNADVGGVTEITTSGLVTDVTITETGNIDVPIASKTEAEEGIITDKAMTPLRTKQAIQGAPSPTTEVKGVVEKSDDAENLAGTAADVYPDVVGVKQMIETHGGDTYLQKTNNLDDVADASTSFTNIKQIATESETGVVEKSDDAENLAGTAADVFPDVAGVAAMINELGGNVYLQKTNNLDDVADASTSFTNIKQIATESETGVVQKSTSVENLDGTAINKFPDVLGVKEMIDATPAGGTGTVTSVDGGGLVTGGPVTTTGVLTVTASSDTQGETGTDISTAMTPASTKAAITAQVDDPLWTESGTDVFRSTGNVGIGAAPSAAAKLEVGGQIKITGGSPALDKVLTSNGVGLASWQTPEAGGLLDIQYFTASGTWVKPAKTTKIEVICIGAGAGGGGNTEDGSPIFGSDGKSEFGTICKGNGGSKGSSGFGSTGGTKNGFGGVGGFSGVGDFKVTGGYGQNGRVNESNISFSGSGYGGGSTLAPFGVNIASRVNAGAGGKGGGFAAGGTGGGGGGGETAYLFKKDNINTSYAVTVGAGGAGGAGAGGNGGDGVVIVKSYA